MRKNKYPLTTVTDEINGNIVHHSSFNSISSSLKINNLERIINDTVKNPRQRRRCKTALKTILVGNITFDIDISAIQRDMFVSYINNCNNHYLSFDTKNIQYFINDYISNRLKEYFSVHVSIGERDKNNTENKINNEIEKSIYFDFNINVFNNTYNAQENWYAAEITYRHLFILALTLQVFSVANIAIPTFNSTKLHPYYTLLFSSVNNYAGLSILSGIEFYTEFDLGSPYGELYEELVQLTPLYPTELVFNKSPENRTFKITIKDQRFLSEAYADLIHAWTEKDIDKKIKITTQEKPYQIKKRDVMVFNSDKFIDTHNISTIRIVQTQNPNIIRVTTVLTGMRIIARVVSIEGNAKQKVFTDTLLELSYMTDNMTANLLWRIFWRTEQYHNEFNGMEKSFQNTYLKFISKLKGNNDKVAKSVVIILLSKMSQEEREKFMKHYRMNERTRKQIEDGLNILNKMIKKSLNKNKEAELIKFLWGLKQYVW